MKTINKIVHKTKKGLIRQIWGRFDSSPIYKLFDNNGNCIDSNIDYNKLHLKLY